MPRNSDHGQGSKSQRRPACQDQPATMSRPHQAAHHTREVHRRPRRPRNAHLSNITGAVRRSQPPTPAPSRQRPMRPLPPAWPRARSTRRVRSQRPDRWFKRRRSAPRAHRRGRRRFPPRGAGARGRREPNRAMNTVFYDALFDENAASHLAFGNAFPDGVTEQADRERVNTSQTHIDFMIGSPDSIITGIHTDSTRVPVLLRETGPSRATPPRLVVNVLTIALGLVLVDLESAGRWRPRSAVAGRGPGRWLGARCERRRCRARIERDTNRWRVTRKRRLRLRPAVLQRPDGARRQSSAQVGGVSARRCACSPPLRRRFGRRFV